MKEYNSPDSHEDIKNTSKSSVSLPYLWVLHLGSQPMVDQKDFFKVLDSSKMTPWCWERLRAGREGDNRGWDGWMASPTRWTWVWVNSRSWWWTGGLACCGPWGRKESDTTEQLNWTEKENLNFPHASYYLHRIYIVLGIVISNLEMI